MKYDEPGIYELTYKTVDECGNETYATRSVTVEAEPPSDIIMTSGASGEIVVGNYASADSESVPVFTPHEYVEEPYGFGAIIIFNDFVENGSEPTQLTAQCSVALDGYDTRVDYSRNDCITIMSSDIGNNISVVNNCYETFSYSWSSVVVKKEV